MTRKCAYLLWLAALISWGPRASAQTAGTGGSVSSAPTAEDGNFNVDLIKAGGKDFNPQERTGRPIGLEACIEGSIVVTLSQLPNSAAYPYLEVWYSTGSGNCQMGDRATRTSGSQNCTKLSHDKESEQINSFRTFNTEIDIKPVCRLNADQTEGAEGPQTLYFLLLQSKGSAEQAQFYRAFTIKIDTHPPDAPKITLAGSGQTDIKLEWELPVSSTNFWVAADYSNGALVGDDAGVGDASIGSNSCNSNYLKQGSKFDPDARPTGLYVRNTESISTSWSFDGALFKGVTKVPVVVVAEDLAGNLSRQSEVACITVEPTTGFWERYKAADGSDAEPGCACSAPGAPTRRNALLATPVALLLVGAFVRRRIRRRAR